MRYKRTQIYLDPEEHRRLVREAADRGVSLAEYLRQVLGQRVEEQPAPYDASAWAGIFDLGNSGAKDTVADMDEEVAQAIEEEYLRSIDRAGTQEP